MQQDNTGNSFELNPDLAPLAAQQQADARLLQPLPNPAGVVASLNHQTGNVTLVGGTSGFSFVGGSGSVTLVGPLTTKGDLYAYSTAGTRFGVGSDGQVLTADIASPQGLKWVTPGTGVGTVTDVTVVSANGFAGTVATSTTTPAITLTTSINAPILAGNGTAISAASTTGTGSTAVLATSPALVTPTLGVATATTINRVTLTAPATGSTLTIVDGKTLTINKTMSLTAADDTGIYTLPTGTKTLLATDGSGSGLSGVTLSAIVPNTAPAAGRILVGNAGGTAYAPVSISGDATLASTGAITLASTIVAAGPIGDATHVPQITFDAKGRLTTVASVLISGVAPSGSAGGDLSGTYPNPTVAKINGVTLGTTTATSGNVLIGSGSQWGTQTISGSGATITLSNVGVITISGIANASLSNSAITINGTSVSLGGTRTLTLASADFVNQGTTTTVLHGNAAGNPSFGAVSLTADVSGVLPVANGGVSQAAWTSYTPTLTPDGGTINTSSTSCFYQQQGKTVHVRGAITLTTVTSGSGGLNASLPVTAKDAAFAFSGTETNATANSLSIYGASTTAMRIWFYNTTTVLSSGKVVTFAGVYEAA